MAANTASANPRRSSAFGGRRLPVAAAICAAAILSAVVYLCWFYRQQTRPGAIHHANGMAYLEDHQPVQAEQEWLQGVQEDPDDYCCYADLGDYYNMLSRYDAAADCYARAASLKPGDSSLWLRLAGAERALGAFKDAAAAARKASDLDPQNAAAVGLYGMLELRLQDREAAIALLTRALALEPGNLNFHMERGLAEMDMLHFAAAEDDFKTCLRLHPGDPEASFHMAEIARLKPRTAANLQAAIDFARQSIQGSSPVLRAYGLLGQLYLEADKPEDALQVLQAGLKLQPMDTQILKGLEDCYGRLGMKQEQAATAAKLKDAVLRHDRMEYLRRRMSFNHNDVAAGMELAHLEADDGDYRQALTHYRQLLRQNPQDESIRKAIEALSARAEASSPAQPGPAP